jgi:hypothetical protein
MGKRSQRFAEKDFSGFIFSSASLSFHLCHENCRKCLKRIHHQEHQDTKKRSPRGAGPLSGTLARMRARAVQRRDEDTATGSRRMRDPVAVSPHGFPLFARNFGDALGVLGAACAAGLGVLVVIFCFLKLMDARKSSGPSQFSALVVFASTPGL